MTYCVGIKLNAGLVFLSDSRTNAGLDQISTFRKMIVYEKPGDRFMVLLSAGNLSISQSVREILQVEQLKDDDDSDPSPSGTPRACSTPPACWARRAPCARPRRRVAQACGRRLQCVADLRRPDPGEGMRLFQVYSAGNFIEATPETPYFQIGESKYGKPVLDRVITPDTPLDEAAKCALVSMDSTLKSNLSVGLPLDMVVYEANRLPDRQGGLHRRAQPLLPMLHNSWGQKLREVFDSIEDPVWDGAQTEVPLMVEPQRTRPLKKIDAGRGLTKS
jgi:putative proteasome-type protease